MDPGPALAEPVNSRFQPSLAFLLAVLLALSAPAPGRAADTAKPKPEKSEAKPAPGEKKGEKKTEQKDKKEKKDKKDKKAAQKVVRKPSAAPRVVINEILYHPVPDSPKREFVELHNPQDRAVDLSGWSLDGEVKYFFPAGTAIPPRGYLVIGGDAEVVASIYGLKGVLGPLKGKLSRKGGTIDLLDAKGDLVEEVQYDDKPPFPIEAAGGGASLERIHPNYKAGWHWRAGATRAEWVRVEGSGLLSGDRLILYLSGEGSCWIDDVQLVPRDAAGPNAVSNPGFEAGLTPWEFTGNHSGSRVETQAKEGKTSLRLAASGPGFGQIHSASIRLEGIPPTSSVKLSFWARAERGAPRVIARIAGDGLVAEEELPLAAGTPGAANSVTLRDLSPWVKASWHEPERPLPGQPVTVFARVEDDDAVAGVSLEYSELDQEAVRTVPMADHGVLAGKERAFAALIPPLDDGAVVRYRIVASDTSGNPAPPEAQKAFYVGKPLPRGKEVGSFEVLMSPAAVDSLERSKASYVPAMVIFDGAVYDRVQVRHRGHSSMGFPKRHFKLKFTGEKLDGMRKINLSASWADKSFLREPLAHLVFAEAGVANCQVKRYARIYLNGKYWGLYYQLEQPGRDYLKRNGRDPDGDLFKCYTAGRPSPSGSYSASDFQNKTQKEPHYNLLHEFLTSMDSLSGAELSAYVKKHVNAEDFAAYLAATALVMNSDHVGKNYYLYRDSKTERWSMFPWDLDLTFGRNFECNGGGLLNDRVRWDNHILFGTEAHPKCDIPGNRLIEKFLSLKENRILLYKKLVKMLKDFNVPRLDRLIRPWYLAIRNEVPLDRKRWTAYGQQNTWDLDRQLQDIHNFVNNRVKFLSQALRDAAANP
jgi:hypothetical protein